MKTLSKAAALGLVLAIMGSSGCVVADRGPGYGDRGAPQGDNRDDHRDDRRDDHGGDRPCDRDHDEHCADRPR